MSLCDNDLGPSRLLSHRIEAHEHHERLDVVGELREDARMKLLKMPGYLLWLRDGFYLKEVGRRIWDVNLWFFIWFTMVQYGFSMVDYGFTMVCHI